MYQRRKRVTRKKAPVRRRVRKPRMPNGFVPQGVSTPYQYQVFKQPPPYPSFLPPNPPETLSPEPLHARPAPPSRKLNPTVPFDQIESTIPMEFAPYTSVPQWTKTQPGLTPSRGPPVNEYVRPPFYPPQPPYSGAPIAMHAEASPATITKTEKEGKSILSNLVDLFLGPPPAPSPSPGSFGWNAPHNNFGPSAAMNMGYSQPNNPPGYFSPVPGPLYNPPHIFEPQYQGFLGPEPSAPPLGYGFPRRKRVYRRRR
jgi:hypothetical protein